jgi:hypothetical protein
MNNEEYGAKRVAQEGDRGYVEGMGEVLRAARLYVAMSKGGFATKLGMAERSFVRMERGERPIPPGLLDTVDTVLDEFDTAVELLTERATRSGDLTIEVTATVEGEWHRAVVGRACIESRRITPILSGIRKEDRP